MLDDRADREARMAAATPHETVRGVVFNAIFAVVCQYAGDDESRRIDSAKKGSRTEFLSYPVRDFLQIIWNAVDVLRPSFGGADPAFYEIGARACELVASSMLGKTLLALGGGGGPRQLLTHTPSGYRAIVSYGERTVTAISEKHMRCVFANDYLVAPYHAGVLCAAAKVGGGKNVRSTGRQTGLLEVCCDVTWD